MPFFASRALFNGQMQAEDLPDAERITWSTNLDGTWDASTYDPVKTLFINPDQLLWMIVDHHAE